MSKQHRWQDARLKKALTYAPDADIKPSKTTRQHILHTASQVLEDQIAQKPSETAWSRLWNLFFGKPQMPWNTAFATFVVVGFVGLIWVVSNPQGTLDRPDTDLLSPTISQAPVPAPSLPQADVPAQASAESAAFEAAPMAPAPAVTPTPAQDDRDKQQASATIKPTIGALQQPAPALPTPHTIPPAALEEERQEKAPAHRQPAETKERMPMPPAPKDADMKNRGVVNAPFSDAPVSEPLADFTQTHTASVQQASPESPPAQGMSVPRPSAPGKAPLGSTTFDALSSGASPTHAEALSMETSPQTPSIEASGMFRDRADSATVTAEAYAPAVVIAPTSSISSAEALNTAIQQWHLAYISDGRTGTYVLAREGAKNLPVLLQELTHTALQNHASINTYTNNGGSNPAWVLAFYNSNNTYLGTLALQGRHWGFSNTTPCQLDCTQVEPPLMQGRLSSKQAKNLATLLHNLAP